MTVTQDTPTYQIPGLSVSVQLFTVERNKIYQPFLVWLAYCLEFSSELLSVLYWPRIDGRYRAVVVVVVELLPDEGLLVPGLGVGGGRARLVRLLRHLHRDLDADLPEVLERRVQAAHLQVSRRHHLGQTLGRGEEHLKIFNGR